MTRGRRGSGEGSATVWLLTVVAVVALITAAVAAGGMAVRMRHRAAAAADAAALAGALRGLQAPSVACAAARAAAAADGAAVRTCVVRGGVATVTTVVRPPAWLRWLGVAMGRARAGRMPADRVEPG